MPCLLRFHLPFTTVATVLVVCATPAMGLISVIGDVTPVYDPTLDPAPDPWIVPGTLAVAFTAEGQLALTEGSQVQADGFTLGTTPDATGFLSMGPDAANLLTVGSAGVTFGQADGSGRFVANLDGGRILSQGDVFIYGHADTNILQFPYNGVFDQIHAQQNLTLGQPAVVLDDLDETPAEPPAATFVGLVAENIRVDQTLRVESNATLDVSNAMFLGNGQGVGLSLAGNFVFRGDPDLRTDSDIVFDPEAVVITDFNAAGRVTNLEVDLRENPEATPTLQLAGTLQLLSGGGSPIEYDAPDYTPQRLLDTNDRFTRVGTFDAIEGLELPGNLAWAVTYDNHNALIQRALQGDANLNQAVEQGDLDAVLNNWGSTGQTWATGDFDGNGTIEQADLDAVLNNWGNAATPPDLRGFSVPEPGVVTLAGLALIAASHRRRAARLGYIPASLSIPTNC